MKPAQPKPLRLKVNLYDGKEGENLHFWVREVELVMDAALISTERLRVAFALSNLGGRAKTWAYTREATTPGCFTTLPANYEYRQRSRFVACKQGKRELHEYIQEMRVLAASLVGNPLSEHIKVTVFVDGLKVGPSRTRLFRVYANTMEEAIQIALQEEYSHRQARTPTSVWQGHNALSGAVQGAPAAGASSGQVPMELGTAVQSSIRCYGCPAGGQRKFPSKPRGSRGPWQKPRPKGQGNWAHQNTDGARHGGLASESLGALETRKSSSGLLVVQSSVRGYGDPFRILIDSGGVDELCSTPDGRAEWRQYDLILGIPWLEKHEPWIDWRGKIIGARRTAVSDRALVSDGPTSSGSLLRSKKYWDSLTPTKILTTGHETKAHCQACGIATTASPNAESRPQAADAVEQDASSVGNIVPRRVEETEKSESGTCVSSVGNEVLREVKKTNTRAEVSLSTSRVDNKEPHSESETPPAQPVEEQYDVVDGVSGRQVKAGAVHLKALPEMSALLNLEELSVKDFLAESTHSTPTFCVRKPNGKWRLVYAYNKLNNATVLAQTPIPRKDVLLNNMSGCTLYSAFDLVDEYYQILMRESDIPLTAVSTPSGMLWEWLAMPQGLSNSPATFNRLVTQLFRSLRTFAQTCFDDIFVHSRADDGQTAMEVDLAYLHRVFEVMRANKLYSNIDKCVFPAEEIKALGCFISRVCVRADPGKVMAIPAWPTPRSQKDPRKWLGLANYLHKYSAGYAELARPLSDPLKNDADWVWEQQHQDSFDSIKASLQQAPVLALPDENKAFSVVCDASDYAIGCALLQKDDEGHERVISFQSRQLKAAERNYPVHDKELLAMKYALVKFRVHLLGTRPFAIYTDHASLRTATNSPPQRMPGKLNVLADALSRRLDYGLAHVSRVTTDLYNRIRLAYQGDENYTPLVRFLSEGTGAKIDRVDPGDPPRVVVPNDEDLKYGILLEALDAQMSDHPSREKIYQAASQTFWWPHMYIWRVKPSGHASAPLQSLPVPADCWKSMSLDFVFGLPADDRGNTGILVFVCRLSKMVHLAPVRDKVTGKQAAQLFLDSVFRYHGLPETIVSDRDPRFTGAFWDTLFQLLGTKLTMSTADHPQTDGQTERVNRVLEDTLRSICAEAPWSWSDQLPMVEFALNNAVHASTGFTPFYLNGLRHPQVPLTLRETPMPPAQQTDAISRVRDAMASAQESQKEYSDKHGRETLIDELGLLDTKKLPLKVVSSIKSNKLNHRFIGPFAALVSHGAAFTIDLPKSMATHTTFYVGRLKR
ncbi:Pol protein [Phytophthora palmivora]|uniref:Pol protein n=1 Tax=Phytophthora palmivora TaxID=4796 RepID=A0A2P4XVG3_9STRA|nr:Pol protein [Phytophthora palmivora]